MKTSQLIRTLALMASLSVVAPIFAADSAAPPSAPAERSQADLEKLLGPIALYPDSLVATILPASVYPLEIVQAARFVQDSANIPKIDDQPWDDNVKAVAHVPEVVKKMSEDLQWTTELGQAFVAQQKEVMTTIQTLRAKAQKSGALKTTEQQIVVVTNTVIQIQPANPQVISVPSYQPSVVYAPAPPSGPPPVLTFAAAVTLGAVIANNCDWNNGGVYVGGNNININRTVNVSGGGGQKWQPDQSRMQGSSSRSSEARGWSSGSSKSAEKPRAARPQTMPSSNPGFSAMGRGSTPMGSMDAPPGGAFSGVSQNNAERDLERANSQRGKASREESKRKRK